MRSAAAAWSCQRRSGRPARPCCRRRPGTRCRRAARARREARGTDVPPRHGPRDSPPSLVLSQPRIAAQRPETQRLFRPGGPACPGCWCRPARSPGWRELTRLLASTRPTTGGPRADCARGPLAAPEPGRPRGSGRDDHGPHNLVRQGLPLGVPEREQVADEADDEVDEVAEVAQEGVQRADGLTGLLADEPHPDDPLAEALALTTQDPPVVEPVTESDEQEQVIDRRAARELADDQDDRVRDPVDQQAADPVDPVGVLRGWNSSVLGSSLVRRSLVRRVAWGSALVCHEGCLSCLACRAASGQQYCNRLFGEILEIREFRASYANPYRCSSNTQFSAAITYMTRVMRRRA